MNSSQGGYARRLPRKRTNSEPTVNYRMTVKEQIEKEVDLSIEDLYAKIGCELTIGLALGESDRDSEVTRGRRWFDKHQKKLASIVCESHVGRLSSKTQRQLDQLLLIAAVADIVASAIVGISPVTVATLLVKEGLIKLCESNFNDSGK